MSESDEDGSGMPSEAPPQSEEAVAFEARTIAQLLGELDQHAGVIPDSERDQRAHARSPFRARCIVRFQGAEGTAVESCPAATRTLSRGGIGLLIKHWFRCGEPLYIILSLPDGSESHLAGKVAFVRPVRGAWFEVGVRFHRRGADDRLAPPAACTTTAPAAEPRAARRAPQSLRAGKLNLLAVARSAAGYSADARATILRMTSSSDVAVRARSAEALVDVGGPSATNHAVRLLSDDKAEVRLAAVGALGVLRTAGAIPEIKRLLSDMSADVCLMAARVLGELGDRSGLDVVSRHLRHDDRRGRAAAVAYSAIVDQTFRPTAEGVADARRYMAAKARAGGA